MATFLIILQLLVVLAMIFIGAKVGSIGLGIDEQFGLRDDVLLDPYHRK